MSQPIRQSDDSPVVVALRKKIRGEALSDEERALLASVSRKSSANGQPLTQEQLAALLSERARTGP